MATTVVFYSIAGQERAFAEGVADAVGAPLAELTDSFSSRPAGWKRRARRAVRQRAPGVCTMQDVVAGRGDVLILVFPYWGGSIHPAMTGFVCATTLSGVSVHLVVVRRRGGGDELLEQMEDDVIRQGGVVEGVGAVRTWLRSTQQLRALGSRLGEAVRQIPRRVGMSLQEWLRQAINDERSVRARYEHLAAFPGSRTVLRTLATAETKHLQLLQEVHHTYTGTVYEPKHGEPPAGVVPESPSLSREEYLQGLKDVVELETKGAVTYAEFAHSFATQQDVVRLAEHMTAVKQRQARLVRRLHRSESRSVPHSD